MFNNEDFVEKEKVLGTQLVAHCYFLDTRSGESVGGSLVGIVPAGSTFTSTSGICAWAGAAVATRGERPRHSLPSLPENETLELENYRTGRKKTNRPQHSC